MRGKTIRPPIMSTKAVTIRTTSLAITAADSPQRSYLLGLSRRAWLHAVAWSHARMSSGVLQLALPGGTRRRAAIFLTVNAAVRVLVLLNERATRPWPLAHRDAAVVVRVHGAKRRR